MKHCKHIRIVGIVLFFIIFMRSGSVAAGNEKMETVYYYVVQPGDNLWKISEELYGDGTYWEGLYYSNHYIFDPALIYPEMKLEIPHSVFPKNPDERFMTEQRKETNYMWLSDEYGYVHFHSETPDQNNEYPKEAESEALKALKDDNAEIWLSELLAPRILTKREQEEYRKKDSEDILYSYEIERGLPEDIWYLLTESDGTRWLIIENQERGKKQEFYRFTIDSTTGEISRCKKIHGAGGRLYLTYEGGMSIWIMTKEICGEVVGIAGEYSGMVYVGGNFYYEKQDDGTIKEKYEVYSTSGSGTIRAEGATSGYPY